IAGVAMPEAVAVIETAPTWVLDVTAMEPTPVLSVVTVAGPVKVTLAPLPGAAKVTAMPGTPLPSASCTLAFNAVAYGALTTADWPLPATTVMLEDVAGPITNEALIAKWVPSAACSA